MVGMGCHMGNKKHNTKETGEGVHVHTPCTNVSVLLEVNFLDSSSGWAKPLLAMQRVHVLIINCTKTVIL